MPNIATDERLPRTDCLERLPTELQLGVLHAAPEVPTLYTLIQASPGYCMYYRSSLHSILRTLPSCRKDPYPHMPRILKRKGDRSSDDVWADVFLNNHSQDLLCLDCVKPQT